VIAFVHRRDPRNVGDRSCCPADYFALGPGPRVDVIDVRRAPDLLTGATAVVIGGGGLFYFRDDLDHLLGRPGCVKVGWGIGTNTHGATAADYRGLDLGRFDLLGLRDAGPDWVPCVSCMSPLLDAPAPPTRRRVTYRHHQHPCHLYDIPCLTNAVGSMAEAVAFLAGAEFVVTNTYHGYYWATLLGRRVVLYRPFSSRFHRLPWPCPVAHQPEDIPAAMEQAAPYPDALAQAREATARFAARVAEVVEHTRGS
jgi:hypothetical protein